MKQNQSREQPHEEISVHHDRATKVVLSRQQRRVQLMKIRQREERLKKENENKKKKKRQSHKPEHKQKSLSHHQHYHHPGTSHPHHQNQSSQPPKVPPPQTEPGYHRRPLPKRRFDGDVLSPSYIRSFRDRQSDRRSYSHSRMMSRSRMAELDYDCGSQVPLTVPSRPPVRI